VNRCSRSPQLHAGFAGSKEWFSGAGFPFEGGVGSSEPAQRLTRPRFGAISPSGSSASKKCFKKIENAAAGMRTSGTGRSSQSQSGRSQFPLGLPYAGRNVRPTAVPSEEPGSAEKYSNVSSSMIHPGDALGTDPTKTDLNNSRACACCV